MTIDQLEVIKRHGSNSLAGIGARLISAVIVGNSIRLASGVELGDALG